MLVSIIIPVYKVEDYIERCLISVFEQTYSNIEIIIVDDCSPDNSINIAKNLIDKYNKQKITRILSHSTNKGLSEARNTGIRDSKASYIYFLDSDDHIEPSTIKVLYEYTKKSDTDMVVGGINLHNKYLSTTPVNFLANYADGYELVGKSILKDYLQYKWYDMAWNKLIKKEFILSNSLFFQCGIYHEDALWSFYTALKARSVVISDKKTYNYHLRSNSITTTFTKKHVIDRCLIFDRMSLVKDVYLELRKDINYFIFIENFRLELLYKCKDIELFEYAYVSMKKSRKLYLKNIFNKQIPIKYKRMIMVDLLPLSFIFKIYSKRNPH